MPLLTLDSVALSYGHLPLFEGADLRVEPGERIALIGRNGSGKSSLLKVVSGEVSPDGGTVWRSPGLRIARLEQDVPTAADRTAFDEVAAGLGALGELVAAYHHAAVEAADRGNEGSLSRLGDLQHQLEEQDGWRLEQKVDLIVSRLALPADRPMRELSGGWRRRVLLGKALVSEPDLLLLDEPTNHLDIDAIRWLEDHLRGFAGALLFVTHDRAFLSALATRIVELDRGRLTSWPGSYTLYLDKKADALNAEALELGRLDKKLEKEEAWLRQGVKARRTRNEGRVKDLMALREQRAAYRGDEGVVRMAVDSGDATGRLVFEARHAAKSLGGIPIIRDYSQRILRGDRVGLIGPNGSGKTTLLRLLLGELAPDGGTIRLGTGLDVAYFDQLREQLDPERSVFDSVADGADFVEIGGNRKHVLGYLEDFLFNADRARTPVRALSGGERNRLMLARLFARPANVLVLDEPTNDLDIETLELLEELIGAFDGTVLLVSHDRVFLDHIVTSTLAFEGDGRVTEYVGGYEDYLRQSRPGVRDAGLAARDSAPASRDAGSRLPREVVRAIAPRPAQSKPAGATLAAGASKPAARGGAVPRKLTFKEKRELEGLPRRIEALESEQSRLQAEAASPDFYKQPADRIRDVLARVEAIGPELEAVLARWMALEEKRQN